MILLIECCTGVTRSTQVAWVLLLNYQNMVPAVVAAECCRCISYAHVKSHSSAGDRAVRNDKINSNITFGQQGAKFRHSGACRGHGEHQGPNPNTALVASYARLCRFAACILLLDRQIRPLYWRVEGAQLQLNTMQHRHHGPSGGGDRCFCFASQREVA